MSTPTPSRSPEPHPLEAQAHEAEEILNEFGKIMPRIARKKGIKPHFDHLIPDALQMANIEYWKVKPVLESREHLENWLQRAAILRFIDAYRSESRAQRTGVAQLSAEKDAATLPDRRAGADPTFSVMEAEYDEWLRKAIESLPTEKKTAARLVLVYGMTTAEAAEEIGKTPTQVSVNVSGARGKLERAFLATDDSIKPVYRKPSRRPKLRLSQKTD